MHQARTSSAPSPRADNHIISGLPAEDHERVAPHLETVDLHHGQVLHRAGDRIDHA